MSAPPPLTDEQKNLVKQFVDVTGASEKQAEFFLDAASYDVQRATSTYFETTGGSSASGGAGNIRTLGGMKKQPIVDPKKEKQRQYTGGASSGMMVEDTPDEGEEEESEGDNLPMDEKSIVDQILAKAKKASEEALRENEEQRANQQTKKYFTGAGRKLGAEDNAVPQPSSNEGSQPQSPELENVERHMTFWRNGFTIEDGPLLRYDDPANQNLLNAIQSGRAPMELFKVKYGQRAEVKVSQRRDEDYVPPAKKIVAFEGEGRRLGSHVPSYTAPPSASSSADSSSQPRPSLVIDDKVPTTSIQIRLADGTRMVAKFNVTHKLSDIIQFIKASRSDQRAFTLQTQFPVKPLTDENSTIETLGLKNAVIIQKYA